MKLTPAEKRLLVHALAELYKLNANRTRKAKKEGKEKLATGLEDENKRIDDLLYRWEP